MHNSSHSTQKIGIKQSNKANISPVPYVRPKTYRKFHKTKLMKIMNYYEKNKYPKRDQILDLAISLDEDPMKIKNFFKYCRRKDLRQEKISSSQFGLESCGQSEKKISKAARKLRQNKDMKSLNLDAVSHSDSLKKEYVLVQPLKKELECDEEPIDQECFKMFQAKIIIESNNGTDVGSDLGHFLGDKLLSKLVKTNGYEFTLENSSEWLDYNKKIDLISRHVQLINEFDKLIESNHSMIDSLVNEIEMVKESNQKLIAELQELANKKKEEIKNEDDQAQIKKDPFYTEEQKAHPIQDDIGNYDLDGEALRNQQEVMNNRYYSYQGEFGKQTDNHIPSVENFDYLNFDFENMFDFH